MTQHQRSLFDSYDRPFRQGSMPKNTARYDEHGEVSQADDDVPELDVNDDLGPEVALEAVRGAHAEMSADSITVVDHQAVTGSSLEDNATPEPVDETENGGTVQCFLEPDLAAEVSSPLLVSEVRHAEPDVLQVAPNDLVTWGAVTFSERRAARKKLRHRDFTFRPGERWKERRLPRILWSKRQR